MFLKYTYLHVNYHSSIKIQMRQLPVKWKFIISLILITGSVCQNRISTGDDPAASDMDSVELSHDPKNSAFYTQKDSVFILYAENDTLIYSRDEYNELVDRHPEFFTDHPIPPDSTYYGHPDNPDFGSEAGQDLYYVLYAWFLKQKENLSKYDEQRSKLRKIFLLLNSMFQKLEYGGTMYGHMVPRIEAYVEYDIYKYSIQHNEDYSSGFSARKSQFHQKMNHVIATYEKTDFETLGAEKADRYREIKKILSQSFQLISNDFYLKGVINFVNNQYRHCL